MSKQTLPPVSRFFRPQADPRRLERDSLIVKFGAPFCSGANRPQERLEFYDGGAEKSPQLSVWVDFVLELPNRLLAFIWCAEAELIVKRSGKRHGSGKRL